MTSNARFGRCARVDGALRLDNHHDNAIGVRFAADAADAAAAACVTRRSSPLWRETDGRQGRHIARLYSYTTLCVCQPVLRLANSFKSFPTLPD